MKLPRENFHAIIYYLLRYSLTRQKCRNFGDEAPSISNVYCRFQELKCGRVSLQDQTRNGRPATCVVTENIDAVHLIHTSLHISRT